MKSLPFSTLRRVLLFPSAPAWLGPAGQSILALIWLLFGFFPAAGAGAGAGASVGVTVMMGMGLWGSSALEGVLGGGESRTSTEKALVSRPGRVELKVKMSSEPENL